MLLPSCTRRPKKNIDVAEALAMASAGLTSASSKSTPTLFFQCKTDFQRHLPIIDFTLFDASARLGDFEPAHIAHSLFGACQRILYRLLKSVRRRPNDFNFLVNVIRHVLIIC